MLRIIIIIWITCWFGVANAQPYASTGAILADYNFGHTLDAQVLPLNVFPNPMNDVLTIWIRDIHPDTLHQVQMLGISGELVLNATIGNRETNLDLSHLPEGWYVLHVRKGRTQLTQRILKTTGP